MTLKLAPNLALDPDYIGAGTIAVLAKRGAGKTYTARVMAEEMWKASVPFVALDPMGAWWGLRSSANGKHPGIPVPIFGGEHGDAPLERTGGALMADLVVDERLSMILDLKSLGSRSAERQFALDFLEQLYRRNRDLVHLFIDEADLFAPQRPAPGDRQLLGATENIVRRGRPVGIGTNTGQDGWQHRQPWRDDAPASPGRSSSPPRLGGPSSSDWTCPGAPHWPCYSAPSPLSSSTPEPPDDTALPQRTPHQRGNPLRHSTPGIR